MKRLSVVHNLWFLIVVIATIFILTLASQYYANLWIRKTEQHILDEHLRSVTLLGAIIEITYSLKSQLETRGNETRGLINSDQNPHYFHREVTHALNEIQLGLNKINRLEHADKHEYFNLDTQPLSAALTSLEKVAENLEVSADTIVAQLELILMRCEQLEKAYLDLYRTEHSAYQLRVEQQNRFLLIAYTILYLIGFAVIRYLYLNIKALLTREADLVNSLREHRQVLETRVMDRTTELIESHQALMDASRKAGMAEVATGVLHNVGNILNSVNLSSTMMEQKISGSMTARIGEAANRVRTRVEGSSDGLKDDVQLGKLLEYLTMACEAQIELEKNISVEAGELKSNVADITNAVEVQQKHAKYVAVFEDVFPEKVFEKAIELHRPLLLKHKIEVTTNYAYTAPIQTDRGKLLQILTNLLANSIDAIQMSQRTSGHYLKFATRAEPDGKMCFSFEDSGVGLQKKQLERLFTYGYTTKPEGHGFGLHTSALHARDLGGEITANSDGPEQGACFELLIEREIHAGQQTSK